MAFSCSYLGMSATSMLGRNRSFDLDHLRLISFDGGSGFRLRLTTISGGVYIDGVKMLGVINMGVKRCETRDSMAGDEFSRLTTVYELESSLCILVRNELNRVVES